MGNCQISNSNLENHLNSTITISRKLTMAWTSGTVTQKEVIQKMVFPEGIFYDLENEAFRTGKVNAAFALFSSLNSVFGDVKQKQDTINGVLFSSVGAARFELAT